MHLYTLYASILCMVSEAIWKIISEVTLLRWQISAMANPTSTFRCIFPSINACNS